MSSTAIMHVMESPRYAGDERLMLILLGDNAPSDGHGMCLGIVNLARGCNCTTGRAAELVDRFVRDGVIELDGEGGYRIIYAALAAPPA